MSMPNANSVILRSALRNWQIDQSNVIVKKTSSSFLSSDSDGVCNQPSCNYRICRGGVRGVMGGGGCGGG